MNRTFYGKYGFVILLAMAFLIPFMLLGTRNGLQSNKNDVKSWLPAGYEETTNFEWYRARFESDMFILASWDGCTLDSPALALLARKLVPPDEKFDPNKPVFFKRAMTGSQILDDLIEQQGLEREDAIERLKGFVIGPDGKQTCLVLSVAQESEAIWESEIAAGKRPFSKFLHAVIDRVYDVAEKECAIPRAKLHLGGPPVDNVAIDREGEKSLLRLAGVSALVGLLMAWWCLRSIPLTAMVFSTAIFCAGLSMAAVWYSGEAMNAILLTMPALVYVAAISGAIHLANYYRDTVRQTGVEGAADRSVRNAWLPLALATGTTAIGLASMCITELVPIRSFGLYSAVGVVISFFVLITYMPAVLELYPLRTIADAAARRFDPGLSPRWRHVGEFIIRRNGLVTVGCLLLMAVGTYGVFEVQTSVKLMRLFSSKARIISDYAWLESHLGPLVPMEVVLRVDKSKCKLDMLEQMKLVGEVRTAVAAMPEVGSTLAAPTFVRSLPRRPSVIEKRTWIVQLDKHQSELRDYLKNEESERLWRVSARVGALTNTDYGEFVKDIRAAVEPVLDKARQRGVEGVTAVYTGLVPLIYKSQASMLNGLTLNFVGDLILIGLAIVFLMRDWSAGFLLMLPCLFPMALVFGAMGLGGIVVDVGTVMVPAVALGVTVDDAIHFMLWVRHGQERGMSRGEAIMFAYGDCARAIYQSWGVIGLGLSCFALSGFTPTQRSGYMMFVMLTLSSIGNLVLLPAMLAGRAGNIFWRSGEKRMRKHEAELAASFEGAAESADDDVVATIPMPARVEATAEEQRGADAASARSYRRSVRRR